MRLITWNVNGIRAVLNKGFLEWFEKESPDILCLQETKAHPDQLGFELTHPKGYYAYFSSSEGKKGYSGVVTYTKREPIRVTEGIGIEQFDCEGRVVMTEFDEFILFNVYFPNGKASTERLQYKMEFYEAFLKHIDDLRRKGKRVIFCGDVNTAHKEIDLARPKENEDVSGFLPIERKWMDRVVEKGYIDSLREFHPETGQYTWWSLRSGARERNVGWRIDYVFLQKELVKDLKDAYILPGVTGSDHCPMAVELDL
jgi:exodeoxyribonuclease III